MCIALTTKNKYCAMTPRYAVFQEEELLVTSWGRGRAAYCLRHARETQKRYNRRGGAWEGHEIYRFTPDPTDEWGGKGSWKIAKGPK